MAATAHDVTDLGLADDGRRRVEWAERDMPVLRAIRERFAAERPLTNVRVAACLHVTPETANLMRALAAGGAEVALCASNPLTTQDDVAAALVAAWGIPVHARRDADAEAFDRHVDAAIDIRPHIAIDDGADVIGALHATRRDLLDNVIAATESTATGVLRLRALEADGVLAFPVIAVSEAQTRNLFDNRYGAGQSTVDALVRATNVLLAGRAVVVAGYGWCGRGVAERARGMGAHVTVLEVDPLRALQAAMDGFRVSTMAEAASSGDVFVTATGCRDVIRPEHVALMRDGAVLANAGRAAIEIDVPGVRALAVATGSPRPSVEALTLADGRTVSLLAEGRVVNLVAAEGHPASVMDVIFASQALAAAYAVRASDQLENRVYAMPPEIDEEIARVKLEAMGIAIDELDEGQRRYLGSWSEGA